MRFESDGVEMHGNSNIIKYLRETLEIVYRNLFFELIHSDNHNNTQIYTDASKTSTGISLAVIT